MRNYNPHYDKLYIRHKYGVIKNTNLDLDSKEDIDKHNKKVISESDTINLNCIKDYRKLDAGTVIYTNSGKIGRLYNDILIRNVSYPSKYKYLIDSYNKCKFVPSALHLYFYYDNKSILPYITDTIDMVNTDTHTPNMNIIIFDIVIRGPYSSHRIYNVLCLLISLFKTNNPLYVSIPSSHWHKLGYKDIYIEFA